MSLWPRRRLGRDTVGRCCPLVERVRDAGMHAAMPGSGPFSSRRRKNLLSHVFKPRTRIPDLKGGLGKRRAQNQDSTGLGKNAALQSMTGALEPAQVLSHPAQEPRGKLAVSEGSKPKSPQIALPIDFMTLAPSLSGVIQIHLYIVRV